MIVRGPRGALLLVIVGLSTPGCTPGLDIKSGSVTPGQLRLAFSIHVEGFAEDVGTPAQRLIKHSNHAARLDALQDAVEPHGVKLTYEPEEPYLSGEALHLNPPSGATPADVTTLAERVAAGHFAAPHSDLYAATLSCPKVYASNGTGVGAYTSVSSQCAAGVTDLTDLKSAYEAVGLATPTYISGICTEADWLSITAAAGFSLVGGTVGWCGRTMSPTVLSSFGSEYSAIHGGTCTGPATCHQQLPLDDDAKLRPWRTSDITNWLADDAAGSITVLPSIGDPRCMAEYELTDESENGCTFTDEDLQPYFDRLDRAIQLATADGLNRSLILTLSVGGEIDSDDAARYAVWAERVKTEYIDTSKASWVATYTAAH